MTINKKAPPICSLKHIEGVSRVDRFTFYYPQVLKSSNLCLKTNKPVEDSVYCYIIKKENEGKPKKVAKIAGLNKFLRIYYARVKEVYQ